MKNIALFSFLFALVFCAGFMIANKSIDDAPIEAYVQLPQTVKAIKHTRQFDWAGELMPLNRDCKERIDKQLLKNAYWHSSTLLYLKRANKYFPTIERVLAEQGVPEDFKYLAVAESGLENAVSSASAVGFWQFRKLAAKEYGLEIYDEVDERYHVEKSTLAASKYLKYLKRRFGTWTNAAAAYNIGPTSYAKILKRQEEDNYYDLNLNKETAAYVFRLIAIKEIMETPSDFGFYIDHEDLYVPVDETYKVKIDRSIPNLSKYAEENGLSYRMLKYYNPWLRKNELTVKNNTYYFHIPR
jgi:hypothetical protein